MTWSIWHYIRTPDLLSLSVALFGFVAILLVFDGQLAAAAMLLVAAAVADYFDGKLARSLGSEREFGKQMDSLADIVPFGAAPAVLAWSVIRHGLGAGLIISALAAIFGGMLLVAGILRLGRYNILQVKGLYIGMPITMNGVIFPAVYFLTAGLGWLAAVSFAATCVISAALMVSSIKIRKR